MHLGVNSRHAKFNATLKLDCSCKIIENFYVTTHYYPLFYSTLILQKNGALTIIINRLHSAIFCQTSMNAGVNAINLFYFLRRYKIRKYLSFVRDSDHTQKTRRPSRP